MTEKDAMCRALRLLPDEWQVEFLGFLEGKKVSKDFLIFLDKSVKCRRACEIVLDADSLMKKALRRLS